MSDPSKLISDSGTDSVLSETNAVANKPSSSPSAPGTPDPDTATATASTEGGESELNTLTLQKSIETPEADANSVSQVSPGATTPAVDASCIENSTDNQQKSISQPSPANLNVKTPNSQPESTPQDHKPADNNQENNDVDDDDDDDDYDPETLMTLPLVKPDSTETTQAESLLQSVLSEFGKKKSQVPSQPENRNPTSNSTDLHKLLSSLEPGDKDSATQRNDGEDLSKKKPEKVYRDLDLDSPQTPEEQKAYEQFLHDEGEYLSGGKWDIFPYGSRLFVGNMPTNKIEKWQLYRIFSIYGPIAQISMKNAYGFVQFKSPESCTKAIEHDQGLPIRGNSLLLQISKPQSESGTGRRERSRSPPRRNMRDKGEYGRNSNWHDRYDNDRGRHRDRSPGYRGNKPSRRRAAPEVMIFLADRLSRNYINYVENGFRNARIQIEVEDIPRRNALSQVIQQLAYDGVHGVVTLNSGLEKKGLVNIQVFQRNSSGNIRYDDYLKIELHAAIDLVLRAINGGPQSENSTKPSPPPYTRGNGDYDGMGQQSQLVNTLQNMDPATLQRVFAAALHQNQQQPNQPMSYGQQATAQYGVPSNQQFNQQVFWNDGRGSASNYGQHPGNYNAYKQQSPVVPSYEASSGSNTQVQSIMDQLARLQGQQK